MKEFKIVAISVKEDQLIAMSDGTELLVHRRKDRGNTFMVVLKVQKETSVKVTNQYEISKEGLPPKPVSKLNA